MMIRQQFRRPRMCSLIGCCTQIELRGNAELPDKVYIHGMSALRKSRPDPSMSITDLAASVKKPVSLITSEQKLVELREEHAALDYQLNTFLQIEDPNERAKYRVLAKEAREAKLQVEERIIA